MAYIELSSYFSQALLEESIHPEQITANGSFAEAYHLRRIDCSAAADKSSSIDVVDIIMVVTGLDQDSLEFIILSQEFVVDQLHFIIYFDPFYE